MATGLRDIARASARVAAAGAAMVLLATALPAQEPPCRDCEEVLQTRVQVERRSLERQVAEMTRQLDALARRFEDEEPMQRALKQASEALRSTKGEGADFARELQKAQKLIVGRAQGMDHDPELSRLVRQLSALETRAAYTAFVQAPSPSGYLGVTYEGESEQKAKNGELLVYHYEYPAIISVTPWSPAAKAGVRAGDTLLAYNEHDVRKGAVSLTKLLRPGETVTLRLRRNGTVRSVPVKVERREARVARGWTGGEMPAAPRPPSVEVWRVAPTTPEAPAAPVALPPGAEGGVFVYSYSPSTMVVAGAELTQMNADLREVFGTERGVLVLRVVAGTPAAEAGLRGGDVIVSASGEPVQSPRVLSAQLRSANRDRELTLEVVRRKQPKTVTLRW